MRCSSSTAPPRRWRYCCATHLSRITAKSIVRLRVLHVSRSRRARLPGAARRNLEADDAAFFDRSFQEPSRTRVIDEAIDGLERRRLALGYDHGLRYAEQVVRHQPRAGRLGDQRTQ